MRETLALGGRQLLLTSNMRTIDQLGAVDAFDSRAGAVDSGRADRLVAGPRDEASAEQVIRATVKNIGKPGEDRRSRYRTRLPGSTSSRITRTRWDLVERTRRRFPSPTIATDRAHASYLHAV